MVKKAMVLRSLHIALALGFCRCAAAAGGEDDRVKSVPGLIFQTNFSVYSGYLYGSNDTNWKMHYM